MEVDELEAAFRGQNVRLVPQVVDLPDAATDVVLNQDPPPDTLIYDGQVITYQVKPGASSELPGRYEAQVRHEMPYDWYDREVRVELVDRQGVRRTLWTKQPLFDETARQTYVAGSAIRIPVEYVEEATVEIYVNETLDESYYLRRGRDPERAAGQV